MVGNEDSGEAHALYRFQAPVLSEKSKAISWFKDSATEHLGRVRGLVAILENHGVPVQIVKSATGWLYRLSGRLSGGKPSRSLI
jgi:hypothetical protein